MSDKTRTGRELMFLQSIDRREFDIHVDEADRNRFISLVGARLVRLANSGEPTPPPKLHVTINRLPIEADACLFGDTIIVAASVEDDGEAWWGQTLVFALVRDEEWNSWVTWHAAFRLSDQATQPSLPRNLATLAKALFS